MGDEARVAVRDLDKMRDVRKIKIVAVGNPVGTTVEVDGVAVRGVTNIRFEHPVGEFPKVTIEILALDGVEISGEAEIVKTAKVVDVSTFGDDTRKSRAV